jgi:muramidase (phage lysozyme)
MNRQTVFILAAGVAAVLLLPKPVPPQDLEDEPDYEAPDILDTAQAAIDDVIGVVAMQDDYSESNNLTAFRWMIRVSEGTAGPEGYNLIVGGQTFDGYADHPRVLVYLPNLGVKSSAAGAYQILRRTWDGVKDKLGLPDFSPASQDAACNELIRQRGALDLVNQGRFAEAVEKCKKEWASLPGAGYGQRENRLAVLQQAYEQAGGLIA